MNYQVTNNFTRDYVHPSVHPSICNACAETQLKSVKIDKNQRHKVTKVSITSIIRLFAHLWICHAPAKMQQKIRIIEINEIQWKSLKINENQHNQGARLQIIGLKLELDFFGIYSMLLTFKTSDDLKWSEVKFFRWVYAMLCPKFIRTS